MYLVLRIDYLNDKLPDYCKVQIRTRGGTGNGQLSSSSWVLHYLALPQPGWVLP